MMKPPSKYVIIKHMYIYNDIYIYIQALEPQQDTPVVGTAPPQKKTVVVTEPESNHESTMIHHPQWFVSVL